MSDSSSEDAIAKADAANERYVACLKELDDLRSTVGAPPLGSVEDEQVATTRLKDTIEAIDATIVAAEEARIAEENAIRLNFKFLAQSEKLHESSRLWHERIQQYKSERGSMLSQGSRSNATPLQASDYPPDDSLAGTFCLVGGALVAIGAFFPYFVATTALGSISRNAFQLGQFLSMTYQGPFILVTGLLLVLRGLSLRGIIGSNSPHPWSPLEWSPLWISIIAAIAVLDAWLGSFPSNSLVHVNRGFGGIVSLVGVLSGFVAMYIHRRNLR
jgi:hypothetical protein